MFVVLDTNVWIKEAMLRSGMGSVAKLYINSINATIALPEVIELETKNHLKDKISSAIKIAKDEHLYLLTLFGSLDELYLPDSDRADNLVDSVFKQIGVKLLKIPFKKKDAYNSFIRTIYYTPPSGKQHQQFKDCLIWENCLNLLEKSNVVLISNDDVFYKTKGSNELNLALAKEIEGKSNDLQIFRKLEDYIPDNTQPLNITNKDLEDICLSGDNSFSDSILSSNGFVIHEYTGIEKKIYATEDPDKVYIEFHLNFLCHNVNNDQETGNFTTSGNVMYNIKTNTFSFINYSNQELVYTNHAGEETMHRSIASLSASISIGRNKIKHTVRKELRDQENDG